MQVHVEYPKRLSMLLGRSWQAYARAQNLKDRHILHFKLAEDDMLFVKFYGRSGERLGCCEESSSRNDNPSSCESDEDGSDGSDSEYGSDTR
ncbi:l-ascorbate oxidase-like protein [Hordeum vulgare]|nr:l-ascorbate oxidase-like protein [Hordeum vulgare]